MMNLFRKRYVAEDAEQFSKTKTEVENLEGLMKNIQGSISAYAPLYLAIKKVNTDISNELAKFYQRYPEFSEIGKAVKDAFEFHNTRIDDLNKKLQAFKSQFEGWFINFEVIRSLWKKHDDTQQNYLHYFDKMDKLKVKLAGKISSKDEEQIVRNDSKLSEAKGEYDKTKNELDGLNEKILYFSYQLVNPVVSELFEAKAKCFENFGEKYQVFKGLSSKLVKMEASYLTGLNPGADDSSKKLRDGTLETVAIRTKMLKRLETDQTTLTENPFEEIKRISIKEEFDKYQNTFSVDLAIADYLPNSSDMFTEDYTNSNDKN